MMGEYDLIINWIFGIGILISLPIPLMWFTKKTKLIFLSFLLCSACLVVRAGLLNYWIIILVLQVYAIFLYQAFGGKSMVPALLLILGVFSALSMFGFGGVVAGSLETQSFAGTQIINGTVQTTLESNEYSSGFYIDPITGALVILIIIGIAVTALSIQVLGSGLGETGQTTARTVMIYVGIWALLSSLSLALLSSIPILGTSNWIILTVFYTISVMRSMRG